MSRRWNQSETFGSLWESTDGQPGDPCTAIGGGVDYTLANGSVSFSPGGPFTQSVNAVIINDSIDEADETVVVTLAANESGTAGSYAAAITADGANQSFTYTILDNDAAGGSSGTGSGGGNGSVSNPYIVNEQGTTTNTFTYTLTSQPTAGVITTFTTNGQTEISVNGSLFAASGTFTFTSVNWNTGVVIVVSAIDDAVYEGGVGTFHAGDITVDFDPKGTGPANSVRDVWLVPYDKDPSPLHTGGALLWARIELQKGKVSEQIDAAGCFAPSSETQKSCDLVTLVLGTSNVTFDRDPKVVIAGWAAWTDQFIVPLMLAAMIIVDILLFGLLLGFSPTLLGLNIARSWSLSPDVLIAMGDKMAEELASPELVARGKQLEALCQTGEAFARAMHPQHFASADSDWRNATNEIRKILGPHGLAVVGRAVKDYLREYNCSLPEAFKIPERLAQEPQSAESAPQESLARNRYLQSCPPALRQALEEVYQHLRSQSVSRVPLEQLITVVIPRAGFTCGCVYLFDHEHSCLRPRVAIGSAQINELVPIRCGLQPLERHALVEALLSGIPTELSASCFDGTPCDAFAGVLGGAQKTGVLYLEGGSALSNMTPQNRMGIFKALRQALNDALRIS